MSFLLAWSDSPLAVFRLRLRPLPVYRRVALSALDPFCRLHQLSASPKAQCGGQGTSCMPTCVRRGPQELHCKMGVARRSVFHTRFDIVPSICLVKNVVQRRSAAAKLVMPAHHQD